MRTSVAAALLMATSAALAACGGEDDAGGLSAEPVPDDPDAVVVADAMAFDPEQIALPADEAVTIVIDNRDDGVNHNVHLPDAPGYAATDRG